MRNQKLVVGLLELSLIMSSALVLSAEAEEGVKSPCNYWRGEMVLAGSTWSVGVTRSPDGSAGIDVPSMWRAGERARHAFSADRASIELPYSLGHLNARVVDCRLVGEVVRSDGARARVSWDSRPPSKAIREEMKFDVNGVTIAATLVRPEGVSRAPLVIVLHGGGDSSREDSPPYTFWADELSRLGLAVLLYDKRGNGSSTGSWRTVGFDERAADVVAMAGELGARAHIDPKRIGLLAVSQGGWVAIRAAQLSDRIAFIGTIAAPVVSPYEADAYASWLGSLKGGLSVDEADERLKLWRSYIDSVRSGHSEERWNALLAQVQSARRQPWFSRRPFDPEPRSDPFVSWYPLVADFDPQPALSKLDIPMLWVYGGADTQSDVGRNAAILTRLRDRLGKPYEIAVLAGGDHGVGLSAKPLTGKIEYFTAAPGFLETVDRWFADRAR